MAEPGRPSELDQDLIAKIRTLLLDGHTYKECQEILGIPASTWQTWKYLDYKGFRTFLKNEENEQLIEIAKKNLNQLLQGDDDKIRADLTKFTLSTLSKVDFSTRSEVTGEGGKPIFLPAEVHDKYLNQPSQSPSGDSQEQEKI